MLPLEPLFVNRTTELAEFDALMSDLRKGRQRHVALLGLRRIGKTMLFDEVRRRYPNSAIVYLALDEIVSTPEDFARAFIGELLHAAAPATARPLSAGQSDEALREGAATIHPDLILRVDEILGLMQRGSSYGALLVAVMRFPAELAAVLRRPLLIMLDEFQEVVRLQVYPGTENLLGTIRAALDRPGAVAYAVAGSRVSAMRNLLSGSESPLFTRFEQLELGPFALDAVNELCARVWDEDELLSEPDSVARLHRLTGGWPFYVQAVAARARQLAQAGDGRLTPDLIDLAFQREVFGRSANLGQNCRYLLETAISADADSHRNLLEVVLRQVARWQPVPRRSLVRRLCRHHAQAQIHRAVNRLIDTDFVRETEGTISMLDPVFALWLTVEPSRRNADALLHNPQAVRRLLSWHEAQHAQDRQEMGMLFERRVENLVRQFRGRTVDGRLFGTDEEVCLPEVRDAGKVRVEDAEGKYGERPDSYEVDVVTLGDNPYDCWAIEAKHRRGAITHAMVQRFLASAKAVEQARNLAFARRWIVAPRGIRADALVLARQKGVLTSGLRQLEKLERLVVESFDGSLPSS